MHLWAKKHGKLTITAPSAYDQHLMQQGYEVEKVAKDYVSTILVKKYQNAELLWQPTYTHADYQSRADAVIHDLDTDTYDIYEIKSTTSVKKEHAYDATFQSIVTRNNLEINTVNLIILNEDYVRGDSLDLENLFVIHDITNEVNELTPNILSQMRQAVAILNTPSPTGILNCIDPKLCPCLDICHPNLPTDSIYNIPMLLEKKKRELSEQGILSIQDVPDDFPISAKQRKIVEVMQSHIPHIDIQRIKQLLGSLEYPLYFLDYETYGAALPVYAGYKPYQPMVFQFSLHIVSSNNEAPQHEEYLALSPGDPAKELVKHMRKGISDKGMVIVWNKTFESGRNKEMAAMYPEYEKFLLGLNARMFDLADIVNKGHYIHPDFLGSWSIKKVLPVMVPELSYETLSINKGDQAMTSWWELISSKPINQSTANALLEYCKLDTLAMVKIWEKLTKLIAS